MDKRPRSRRKKKNNIHRKTTVTFIGVLIGLGIAGGIILSAKGVEDGKTAGEINIAPQQEEQLEAGRNDAGIMRSTERTPNPGQAVVNTYENIGLADVSGYLNIRSSPENQGSSNVIGQMPGYAAGEILETLDGWYRIRSGSIVGYISSDTQYTAVGAEALQLVLESAEMELLRREVRLPVLAARHLP